MPDSQAQTVVRADTSLRKYVKRHRLCLFSKSVVLALVIYLVGTFPVVGLIHVSIPGQTYKVVAAGGWASLMAFAAEWVRGYYWGVRMRKFYVGLSKSRWRIGSKRAKAPPQ